MPRLTRQGRRGRLCPHSCGHVLPVANHASPRVGTRHWTESLRHTLQAAFSYNPNPPALSLWSSMCRGLMAVCEWQDTRGRTPAPVFSGSMMG
jgi:hypothetical protein